MTEICRRPRLVISQLHFKVLTMIWLKLVFPSEKVQVSFRIATQKGLCLLELADI